MTLYDRLADLPLEVEGYELERRERETSSGFTRVTTVVALHGPEATGYGEDVTYDAEDHDALHATPRDLPLAGEYTHREFSAAVGGMELFPAGPTRPASANYRRWALESAALNLALERQETSLADALGRSYDPVRFVVSTRLGDPPTADRVRRWLDLHPGTEFKLDPTSGWTPGLVEELADTGAVRVLDLKGQYHGTVVDQPADPALYERVLEGFPEAVVEDPEFTPETRPLFEGHQGRVSWDYPVTGVGSVRDLPVEPSWINIKPSRFGAVESLLDTVEYCRERGIELYAGGQFELDVGREHVQAVASLFSPDAPNDVAPRAYNDPEPRAGLPASPLEPAGDPTGLAWPST